MTTRSRLLFSRYQTVLWELTHLVKRYALHRAALGHLAMSVVYIFCTPSSILFNRSNWAARSLVFRLRQLSRRPRDRRLPTAMPCSVKGRTNSPTDGAFLEEPGKPTIVSRCSLSP